MTLGDVQLQVLAFGICVGIAVIARLCLRPF